MVFFIVFTLLFRFFFFVKAFSHMVICAITHSRFIKEEFSVGLCLRLTVQDLSRVKVFSGANEKNE